MHTQSATLTHLISIPTVCAPGLRSHQVYKDFGSVHGVFTRDFKSNTLNARVLITLPECLEALLLDARNT